jgi:hypothetical protein
MTASGAIGSNQSVMDLTGAVPQLDTHQPTVGGIARIGQKLTETVQPWGPGIVEIDAQWYRDHIVIDGANKSTYTPTQADAGKRMSVKVTGKLLGYATATVESAQTGIVTGGTMTSSTPLITGTRAVGGVLSQTSTWAPIPTALAYQWKRNGASIAGATKSTYTLTKSDAGHLLTVTVTGTKAGFTPLTRTSSAATIPKVMTSAPIPKISGTPSAGHTLKIVLGKWNPSGVTPHYAWKLNGVVVGNHPTYVVRTVDVGKIITLTVTGTKAGYTAVTRVSAARHVL